MRLRSIASLNMPQLSVEVFVDEMERLGLRLGVTRLADGKVRLNRKRQMGSSMPNGSTTFGPRKLVIAWSGLMN